MTKRTILVTGSAGFVGRQILAALAGMNMSVKVLLREGSALPIQCSEVIEDIIYSQDIFRESTSWWKDVCTGVDTIIHAAWYAEPGKYLLSPKNLECLSGTLRCAQGAVQAGVQRFIGVGTCLEYDLECELLSTDCPLKPITPYAGAKAATYLALLPFLAAEGVEFAWCRLFYLYGEGEDSRRLVPYLHTKLAAGEPVKLSSGQQIRDYMDVKEAGEMISKFALSSAQGAINVCSGKAISVRQLAESIADAYQGRRLLQFGARPEQPMDPPSVVGVRTELPRLVTTDGYQFNSEVGVSD